MGELAQTRRLPAPTALAELIRIPAALTVPGDTLAGGAAAGWPFGLGTPVLAASSVCLYWAGMALNDYADRTVDATERPARPIPSGRVRPGFALGLATALTGAGVGLAAVGGGRRALTLALPLAGTIWAYDLMLKSTPAGPAAMASARALDVLMGAGTHGVRRALPAAAAVGAHTLSVTLLSRDEVAGATGPRLPAATLAATVLIAGGLAADTAAADTAAADTGPGASARLLTRALLSGYAAAFGRAQLRVIRDPAAPSVRRAVSTGILSLIPLQGALAGRAGAPRAAIAIAAAFPLGRLLARKFSPT